jgi:hypothetical protein
VPGRISLGQSPTPKSAKEWLFILLPHGRKAGTYRVNFL